MIFHVSSTSPRKGCLYSYGMPYLKIPFNIKSRHNALIFQFIFCISVRSIVTRNILFQPHEGGVQERWEWQHSSAGSAEGAYRSGISRNLHMVGKGKGSDQIMEKGKRRDNTDARLRRMLMRYRNKGVQIFLEGQPSTPQEVVKKLMVREDQVFMPDYVTDMNNRLVQIRYDLVK